MYLCVSFVNCENKYSEALNTKKEHVIDFRNLQKPFRMAKLNLLWTKAQVRLTEPKLKSLFSDLKIHDKEELTHKRLKSEGSDKDGMKEATIRKKLIGIMSTYGLLEHFETVQDQTKHKEHEAFNGAVDDHINRSLFKDKKLSKLWAKAETSGFTNEELRALKEEFTHHQDKIDQYYSLLAESDVKPHDDENAINKEELENFNTIDVEEEDNNINKDYLHKANLLRDKHRKLRDGYDRLHRLAARGPNSKDFVEPKVQGLWRIALEADFKPEELESLRVELKHYEARLLKLRQMHVEQAANVDKHMSKIAAAGDKLNHFDQMDDVIKKHARKVEKMHLDIENRIMERHSEL